MQLKNKTVSPRGYISWQQISLIEKDPKEYVLVYIYGKKRNFKSMENGKKIHKKLSKGIRPLKMNIPLYPVTDLKMECVLRRGNKEVIVIGELDGYNPDVHVVGEYKTDTKLWSESRATTHDQQKLYALMKYKETGKIPTAELTCLETENVLGTMKLTGKYITHRIIYSLKDMLEMESRVWRAHEKILRLVENELTEVF